VIPIQRLIISPLGSSKNMDLSSVVIGGTITAISEVNNGLS
jgi:hypothetical protein